MIDYRPYDPIVLSFTSPTRPKSRNVVKRSSLGQVASSYIGYDLQNRKCVVYLAIACQLLQRSLMYRTFSTPWSESPGNYWSKSEKIIFWAYLGKVKIREHCNKQQNKNCNHWHSATNNYHRQLCFLLKVRWITDGESLDNIYRLTKNSRMQSIQILFRTQIIPSANTTVFHRAS